MKRIWWCLLAILVWPRPLLSQLSGNATLVLFPGAPTGTCNSRQLALDQSSGSLYTCINAAATNQGTWQIVAGGGPGGGGWNPPTNTPGDTIFGNNTVATGSPSFFTPGGDVSFSAGNFSVNRLHFGPNALSLTNTGIATGNCLQVSGSTLIGGACGTSSGGLSGSGTVNLIPKFTAATALGNSLLTDNGTTLTYTGTGGIVAPKISITQGPFQLTSVEGALPALPGANNNMLVSGPDGWYVSNANSAFFKIEPPGSAPGGTGVASFNSRTGAVLPANNDYAVSQVTGAAPLASPAFTGTPTAPAPTGAAATSPGNNQIATTAFVFANAGTGGLTGTGTTNYITKWTGTSSLGNALLSDNGTTLNYTGTGGITTVAPSASEDSNRVATTSWVKANFQSSGGGGGGTPITQITHSAQAPTCAASADGVTSLDVPATITAGDTVLVFVNNRSNSITNAVTDDGANNYSQASYAVGSGSNYARTLLATAPSEAKAATTIHVTASAATRMSVCVATYIGVAFLTAPGVTVNTVPAAASATIPSPPLITQDANNLLVATFTVGAQQTTLANFTWTAGAQAATPVNATNPNGIATWMCEYAQPTANTATACTINNSGGTSLFFGIGIELRCCAGTTGGGGGLTPGMPKVVAYKKANITITTSSTTDVAFLTCPATDCPAGYYRVTWDSLSLGAGCSTGSGNGTIIANVDYFDEFDSVNPYHTGIGSNSRNGPGRNHEYWSRLMTVAKPLNSTDGIAFSTSTQGCPSASGTTQTTISVERLQ